MAYNLLSLYNKLKIVSKRNNTRGNFWANSLIRHLQFLHLILLLNANTWPL